MKIAMQRVKTWNAAVPPGTSVWLIDDNGNETPTRTRSYAYVLGDRPVVLIDGVRGRYHLDRVFPRYEEVIDLESIRKKT